jgi:hypothetical protein
MQIKSKRLNQSQKALRTTILAGGYLDKVEQSDVNGVTRDIHHERIRVNRLGLKLSSNLALAKIDVDFLVLCRKLWAVKMAGFWSYKLGRRSKSPA